MRTACLVLELTFAGVCGGSAAQELSLRDAVRIAEQHHPRLQAMVSRRNGAQLRAKAVSAMLSPQISMTGWLAQGNVENMLASAASVMPDSMRMAPRDPFASVQSKITVPLYTGGRLQAMAGASRAGADVAAAEVQEALQEVRLDVTARYLQALLKRSLMEVAEMRLQAQQEQTRIMEALYEQGKVPLAYVLRSRAAEAEATQSLTTARNDLQKSLLELQASMGVSPTGEVRLPALSPDFAWNVPSAVDEATQRAMRGRALLRAQGERVRMMRLEQRGAEGALSPQAYVTASADWWKATNLQAQSGFTVALVLSVPLWNGELQARVQEASAVVLEEEANWRLVQIQVENEVRQAWLDMHTAEANHASARLFLQNAEETYRVSTLRVQEGKAPFVEQIDALAALTDARTRLLEAQTAQWLARARLLRAMGEL